MEQESKRLDEMQSAYKDSFRRDRRDPERKLLASVNHSVAEIDCWEHAHSHEENSAIRRGGQERVRGRPAVQVFRHSGIIQ